MTKEELLNALKDVSDDAQVRVGLESDNFEFPIVGVIIEAGEALIEFRDE